MSDRQERKGTLYRFATIGARTERGGRVTSGHAAEVGGLPIACVGDIVTYADGAEAVIIDGAGYAATHNGAPYALVGSSLSNGDRIVETLSAELDCGIFLPEGKRMEGLFDPDWIAPPPMRSHRFAVRGATTPRGGVLREATSNGDADHSFRNAARIGDFIEYADGTRARIVTGIGMPGNPEMAYAIVGSLLDNGDVINDSPHRKANTSSVPVPMDDRGNVLQLQ